MLTTYNDELPFLVFPHGPVPITLIGSNNPAATPMENIPNS